MQHRSLERGRNDKALLLGSTRVCHMKVLATLCDLRCSAAALLGAFVSNRTEFRLKERVSVKLGTTEEIGELRAIILLVVIDADLMMAVWFGSTWVFEWGGRSLFVSR